MSYKLSNETFDLPFDLSMSCLRFLSLPPPPLSLFLFSLSFLASTSHVQLGRRIDTVVVIHDLEGLSLQRHFYRPGKQMSFSFPFFACTVTFCHF